jgi:hypothetical protein
VRLFHVLVTVLALLVAGAGFLAGFTAAAVEGEGAAACGGASVAHDEHRAPMDPGSLALDEGADSEEIDSEEIEQDRAHAATDRDAFGRRWPRPSSERSPQDTDLGRDTPPPRG